MIKMLIHSTTGEFKGGGFYEPTPPATGTDPDGNPIYDPAYSVVAIPGESMPDPRTERYDAGSPTKRRPATAPEVTAYDDAQKDIRAVSIDDDKLIQAVAQVDFEERQKLQVKAGQTLLTAQQTKARIRAIYRGLL